MASFALALLSNSAVAKKGMDVALRKAARQEGEQGHKATGQRDGFHAPAIK